MKFGAIWALCVCGLTTPVLSAQFIASVVKRASLDLSCGFATDGLYSITLPQNVSSDLFGNSLQLRVSLPQGTRIVDSNIKAIWQGKTVPTLTINRDFGLLEFSVVLKAGQLAYEVMIQNEQSIVNPAFIGSQLVAFQFLPSFSMNTIFGAANVTYSTGPGSLVSFSALRSLVRTGLHQRVHAARGFVRPQLRAPRQRPSQYHSEFHFIELSAGDF